MIGFLRMEKLIKRHYWIDRIERAWRHRPVLWISGVRRAGKTFLCQSLDKVEYFDCELPRVRRSMKDPEGFLDSLAGKRIILDEIHRLNAPAELLKIAADHYSTVRIIATGSSTLGASRKFKDTLTGRKVSLWLTPMISRDLEDFRNKDMDRRLLRGGVPPFFLAPEFPERDFQEWLDAYWAKDIQELFRLERRDSFLRFVELVMARSGGIFEASKFAPECEVSRATLSNYLRVLEATLVAHVIRPFSTRRATEIVAAPKVYGFDTGFAAYLRGWQELRPSDRGQLWEHFVLNEIHGRLQECNIRYWRDKRGHEVDFVWTGRGQNPTAIECKWSADDFDAAAMKAFRYAYPKGKNFVVARDVDRPFKRKAGPLTVAFVSLEELIQHLAKHESSS